MQNCLHNPETYDFRRYDQVWKRVGPQMEPYPGAQGQTAAQLSAGENGLSAAQEPAVSPMIPQPMTAGSGLTPAQEANLPGAFPNPCCLGTAAAELLEVLTGYIEEELEDQRTYRALARTAPSWARQILREIGMDEGGHARRLMAVYYLITGTCYCPAICTGTIQIDHWCAALRSRYHAEVCGGLNYERTADETTDLCLSKILRELSADEYRHAELIMAMLERSLRCGNEGRG